MSQRTLSEQEFNTIRQKALESAPDGLSEADFTRYITPVIDGAIAHAENSPEPLEGSTLGRFAAGAWSVLNPVTLVKGAYQAVRHPVDTATAVAGAQADQFRKAAGDYQQGRYAEMIGHGAAGVLPLIGPTAAAAGERIGVGDVAGGLGEGVGLLAPFGAKPAVRAVRGSAPDGLKATIAERLETGAANRVADVMSPKVGPNKTRFGNMAEKVAPKLAADLAEDGAPISRTGFHGQVGAKLVEAEQALDAASDTRLSASTFQTKPLIDALLEKRRALTSEAVEGSRRFPEYQGQPARAAYVPDEFNVPPNSGGITPADIPTHQRGYRTLRDEPGRFAKEPSREGVPLGTDTVPAPNRARVAVIDQAIAELRKLGPVTRYDPIRVMRQAYDGPAKAVYAPAVTADYMKAQGGKLGAADVTGVLRENLAQWDPQTATANAQYSLYRTADDVLSATAEVERTRPKVGRQIIARMAGTILGQNAAGVPGAVAGYVAGPLVDSALSSGMTTQLKTAALMSKLATAIRKGDTGRVYSLTSQLKALAPSAARATGRATSPSGLQTEPAGATGQP